MATSTISRKSDSLDIWGRRAAPQVEINFAGQRPGLVNSYTTGDKIEGTVTISVERDTRFDEIEIIFQGNIIQETSSYFEFCVNTLLILKQ